MRIRRFSFMGIRGLDGFKRDLPRNSDTDVTVVYGRYARGKTTFLDTIAAAKEAVGPYGSGDARWDSLVGSSVGAAKVEIDWELSDEEKKRSGLAEGLLTGEAILGKAAAAEEPPKALAALLSQPSSADRGSVHYLHDTRDLTGPLSYGASAPSQSERLTTRNAKFSDLYDVLDQNELRAAKLEGAKRFAELFPDLEIAGLRRTGISFVPTIRNRQTGVERTYQQLCASERHGFLVALYTAKAPIVDSVVLIDAPELGFGDDGAVDLVRALLRWTHRTQIIVATASNAIRTMSEAAHVLELP